VSAIKVTDLDKRLHSILVVMDLGGHPIRSVMNYADAIEKAPRLVIVGHLLVIAARVLRGRSVA
jgi:hypothetical protein